MIICYDFNYDMTVTGAELLNQDAIPPYYEISIRDLHDELAYFCAMYPRYPVAKLLQIVKRVNRDNYLRNGWHILYTVRGLRLGVPWG